MWKKSSFSNVTQYLPVMVGFAMVLTIGSYGVKINVLTKQATASYNGHQTVTARLVNLSKRKSGYSRRNKRKPFTP